MTTVELIEAIHIATGEKKETIAKVVSFFIEETKKSLHNGESVKLRGFGSFFIKQLKSRTYFGGKRVSGPRSTIRFQPSRRTTWTNLASNSTTKK